MNTFLLGAGGLDVLAEIYTVSVLSCSPSFKTSYKGSVLAEYVWLGTHNVPRSKTVTITSKPEKPEDLRVWNHDGSSTE